MPEALAWWAYSDPELTARERERIFARAWQYVGYLGELGDGAGTSRLASATSRSSSRATAKGSCAPS